MQILEFYHKDQKSPESIQRFEINTCLLGLSIAAASEHTASSAPVPTSGKQREPTRPRTTTTSEQQPPPPPGFDQQVSVILIDIEFEYTDLTYTYANFRILP